MTTAGAHTQHHIASAGYSQLPSVSSQDAPLEAALDLPGIGRVAYVADPGGAVIEWLQEA